jgi:hypothetical protein
MSGLTIIGQPFKVAVRNARAVKGYTVTPHVVATCNACGERLLVTNRSASSRSSCGCLGWKHGKTKTRAYVVWDNMMRRCTNPNDPRWPLYGGRGIKVCKKWLSFSGFYEDMSDPPEGLTLDRIDNDGGYSKQNCRWVDIKTQCVNRSTTKWITIGETTKCLKEWSAVSGTPRSTIHNRLNRGMSPEQAIFGNDRN